MYPQGKSTFIEEENAFLDDNKEEKDVEGGNIKGETLDENIKKFLCNINGKILKPLNKNSTVL